AGCGIALCVTLLIFGLFGWFFFQPALLVLVVIQLVGGIIYVSAIVITMISIISLRLQGKPESGFEDTTTLIERGIFRVVRHPLYLGLIFWSIGLILLIQSIPTIILGIVAIICLGLAAKKEDQYNIVKWGNSYSSYMGRVPMFNFIKGLKRLREKN
ncbi:MAG: methyltransferase family protein, partial [Promethearchaeota archaeon]